MDDTEDVQFDEPDAGQLAALASFMPDFEVVDKATSDTASIADPDTANPPIDTVGDASVAAETEVSNEFTYRLFSNVTTTKVALPTTDEGADTLDEDGEVRYIHVEQKRPFDYYFQPSRLETLQQCTTVMDGETVLRLAQQPWPGCAASDRVMHITADTSSKPKSRWRPSKARRERFKLLKAQEDQKERQRAASRAGQRGRGGRGPGRGQGRGASTARAVG